jgi:V/A-type H+-transporting ATPase subunit I
MDKVMMLLEFSVGAGILIISMGVILNIINKMRSGDWAAAIFDRFGLVGIAFYWGALGLGVRLALDYPVGPGLAAAVILIPLALLFLKEPVQFVLARRGLKVKPFDKLMAPSSVEGQDVSVAAHGGGEGTTHEGGAVGFFIAIIEGCVEVLEALLLYTANTASFMRLGAYALSHAGLCLVIFALGDAVASFAGGVVWSMLLIVLGNAVIIALEGLVVAVQALRLQYYEFFNKFFSGEGKAYEPFNLKSEEP